MMWWILAAFVQAASLAEIPDCSHDRGRLLALDQESFDQDIESGWRSLASRPGCEVAAADLIQAYREAHNATDTILFWHEGQLRVSAGQSDQAVGLFNSARHGPNPWGFDDGWNHYVDASIAFLRKDKAGLLAARTRLAAVPVPEGVDWRDDEGNPISAPSDWPPNLAVVDGFVACFAGSCREAYGQECRPKAAGE